MYNFIFTCIFHPTIHKNLLSYIDSYSSNFFTYRYTETCAHTYNTDMCLIVICVHAYVSVSVC